MVGVGYTSPVYFGPSNLAPGSTCIEDNKSSDVLKVAMTKIS